MGETDFSKATERPWRQQTVMGAANRVIVGPDGRTVCQAHLRGLSHDAEEAEANATLIVAAVNAFDPERERKVEALDDQYVVWSHEHGCWWRPECAGYTIDVRHAGVYSRKEALSISHRCRDGWHPDDLPSELPVRVADLPEFARDALHSLKGGENG